MKKMAISIITHGIERERLKVSEEEVFLTTGGFSPHRDVYYLCFTILCDGQITFKGPVYAGAERFHASKEPPYRKIVATCLLIAHFLGAVSPLYDDASRYRSYPILNQCTIVSMLMPW